jgi:PAS domain S-box-containing protein
MPNVNLSQKLPSLASIVVGVASVLENRQPLVVASDLPLLAVISLMSQARGHTCWVPNSVASDDIRTAALEISAAARHSAVLVQSNNLLVGILTERDLIELAASQIDLHTVTVGDVMTPDPITLVLSKNHTVMTALAIFQQHQIRHLPILDERQQLIGMVTPEHIRQILQPVNLLKFRSIAEEMITEVICAAPTTTILEIAQIMVERKIGSIAIVEGDEPLRPVGIITAGDVIQFQAFELDLDQILAQAVMSSPLCCLPPTASLWTAHQMMQSKNIRRLVITNDLGELEGLLTQSDLLKSIDLLEMLSVLESLQSQSIVSEAAVKENQAIELERIEGELQAEVARREQVKAQLSRAAQTLAEPVVARTAESGLLTEELHIKTAEQESIEIALEVSQQGISDFIENAQIGMHWVDIEGIIVWANQAEINLLGYDRSEYIGQPLINFHLDRSKFADVFQQLLNNQSITGCEAQMRRKDGSICDVSIDSNAFFKNGKFIHARCFTRDISKQQAALRERKQLERERERFLAVASDLQLILGNNGYFHWVSPTFESTLGWTSEEMTSCQWTEFLHPDDINRSVSDATSLFSGQETIACENRYRHKDGSYRWLSWHAQPALEEQSIYAVAVDITERKAAEQKIQEQAALLNVTTDAIIVQDLDGQIQFWNNAAEGIYGWQAGEAMGMQAKRLFRPDNPLEVSGALNTVRQQGAWQGELHKLTKTGKEVIVESRWTLIRDEAGQPTSILSVETDITEKKLLEQQFLRAQRLESLGSLASGIAHDLNNILTPIVGAAQLLPLTLPSLDDRNRRLLNMLVESSQRGSSLVKQILTFARGMDGERAVLQVRHILAEIISVAQQTFPRSISISLNLTSEDLWLVSVNATQIHQVLMNLFVNARDAMPNGGKIAISAENIVIDAAYTNRNPQPLVGSYLLITITDTGIGMNSQTIDRIFDPFFTTKETGTGLGLSTVLGIIKAHGGSIEVESEVGCGTCFKIYLPAIDRREAEAPTVDADLDDGKGQLVLVVDDEVAIREITKESLETYNYRVMLASDGIEAIDIYAQNYSSIAIVLVDMMMPHLDTRSIILALQQINPQVRIVLMSGSALDPESSIDWQEISAFLTKPFTTTEMLQTLASICLERVTTD